MFKKKLPVDPADTPASAPILDGEPLNAIASETVPLHTAAASTAGHSKKRMIGTWFLMGVAILILAGGIALWLMNKPVKAPEESDSQVTSATPQPTAAPTLVPANVTGSLYYRTYNLSGEQQFIRLDLATKKQTILQQDTHAPVNAYSKLDRSTYTSSLDPAKVDLDRGRYLYLADDGLYEVSFGATSSTAIFSWNAETNTSGDLSIPPANSPDTIILSGAFYTKDPEVIVVGVALDHAGYAATYNRTSKQLSKLPGTDYTIAPNPDPTNNTLQLAESASFFLPYKKYSSVFATGSLIAYGLSQDEQQLFANLNVAGNESLISIQPTTGAYKTLADIRQMGIDQIVASGDTLALITRNNNVDGCTYRTFVIGKDTSPQETSCKQQAGFETGIVKAAGDNLIFMIDQGSSGEKEQIVHLVRPGDMREFAQFTIPSETFISFIDLRQ